jgi:hypothetical protein
MTIPVEADFLADLRRLTIARISAEGYTADATLGTEALVWNWLKIRHRRIARRNRAVEWSSQLRAHEAALLPWIRAALGRIEVAVRAGDDLNPYLSRHLVSDKTFTRNDMMLNELGVQHFHLGQGLNAKGLVHGTDELLFAYVTDEAAYFVEIFDHKSFGDEEAFRIAQENWSYLFAGRRAGIAPSRDPQPITPEQRNALRAKHANVLVSATDGTLFQPPGGGIMSSGMSPSVVIDSDRLLDRLAETERWCKENGALLTERFERESGKRASSLRLRFDGFEESGALVVMDDDIRARFRFEQALEERPLHGPR